MALEGMKVERRKGLKRQELKVVEREMENQDKTRLTDLKDNKSYLIVCCAV